MQVGYKTLYKYKSYESRDYKLENCKKNDGLI